MRLYLGAGPAQGKAAVWLVKFDRPHRTAVTVGENEGRTLTDFSAVRTFRQLGTWTGAAIDMECEAIDPEDPGDGGCAVLV